MTKKCIVVHGLGSIGMRHARNLIRLGHDVIGYDTDKDKIAALETSGGQEDWPQHVDGVVIATPTALHAETLHAYQTIANVPIFVEKPIATTVVPTKNIVMVGYNLRFHACVRRAVEWIEAGHLGRPLWANFICAQENSKYQDSVILNWSHEIDLALYLLGPVYSTKANIQYVGDVPALADLSLQHTNCCFSTVHLDYYTRPEIRQTIVVGETGQIILDLCNRRCWLRDARGLYIDEINHPVDSWEENYYDEMRAFIERIDGINKTIGCTADEALEVLKICLTAQKIANGSPASNV